MAAKLHSERKHSKYSASGSDRWFNCPGSVDLSEGVPRRDSVWSLEGTKAHEVLEGALKGLTAGLLPLFDPSIPRDMVGYARDAAKFILDKWEESIHAEIMFETRVHLKFIHPEMFGTFDAAVIEHFGTLHVFDYKYGQGHAVSPVKNLQMIFYAIGLAALYDWNFSRVKVWIIQPRIKGYDGPTFWEMSMTELKGYVPLFRNAVQNVQRHPDKYVEGSWCHWCPAKLKCPVKQQAKLDAAKLAFSNAPLSKGK